MRIGLYSPALPFQVLAALAFPLALAAQVAVPPLFAGHETLHITLEADFDRIHKDRGQESEYQPARLLLEGDESTVTNLPLKIKTRGKFRLKRSTCRYPPLRLNFPTDSVAGTVFEGQDRIKLVTHCRDRDSSEQNTLEEYVAYRIYNQVTDQSFRVRLALITYVDSRGKDDPVIRYGFLIEDEDAMAARLGGNVMDVALVHPMNQSSEAGVRQEVFQYLIGNTDFSTVYMHNTKLVQVADLSYVSVPYDFDWSGLVEASYAEPDEKLDLRTVRERLYWGFCRPDVDFPEIYDEFRAVRSELETLFTTTEGLDERSQRRGLEYLEDFYEVIDDPGRAEHQIVGRCRDFGAR